MGFRSGLVFRVQGLNSFHREYIGEYYRVYEGGYQEFRQWLIWVEGLLRVFLRKTLVASPFLHITHLCGLQKPILFHVSYSLNSLKGPI